MDELTIFKKKGVWYCVLNIDTSENPEHVTANNWGELMVGVANEGWIDLINKNE